MEKDIPLWFRMEVGRDMYEAESDLEGQGGDRSTSREGEGRRGRVTLFFHQHVRVRGGEAPDHEQV